MSFDIFRTFFPCSQQKALSLAAEFTFMLPPRYEPADLFPLVYRSFSSIYYSLCESTFLYPYTTITLFGRHFASHCLFGPQDREIKGTQHLIMRLVPRSGSFHSTITADGEVPNATNNNNNIEKVPRAFRKKGVQRTVTWSARCLVRTIPRIVDLSEEEIAQAYYTKEDSKRIQEDISETAFLMKHGATEGDDISFRGLERKRAGEARKRKLHRMMVCRAVMAAAADMQPRVDKAEYDEVIRHTSRSLTASCTVTALERAAQDALEVDQSPLPTSGGVSLCQPEKARFSSVVPVVVVCQASH